MGYDRKAAADSAGIIKQNHLVTERKLADVVSEYVEDFVGVLNSTRQFVLLNENYFNGREELEKLLGRRPGEVFSCVHEGESEYGCGNSDACGHCGTVATVIESINSRRRVTRDCKLLVNNSGPAAMNIRVTAIPVDVDGELFILLFIKDISREKRLELLERAFFHDILNSSASLKSLVSISKINPAAIPDADKSIEMNIADIIEQIQYFQKLKMAEDGELSVERIPVNLSSEIQTITQSVRSMDCCMGKTVRIIMPEKELTVQTDRVLFRRIVLNLLKNALEASEKGEEVLISLEESAAGCRISVSNSKVMTPEVKYHVFQRSFSTKGPGRGIGTYSIKVLGERYLGGEVGFTSEKENGTVFSFVIPGR